MAELGLVEAALLAGLALALVMAYKLFCKTPTYAEEQTEDPEEDKDAEEEDENLVPMSIFFATQTGTSEEFAQTLAKEARRNGYKPTVHDLEEYDHEEDLPKEKFAVFLMSTFGEGEPTDSAQGFDEWLKSQEQRDLLSEMTFSVFALGNKQYEKFCEMGKKTDRRLAKLGGKRLFEVGLGDDDDSIEDDFNEWKQNFFQKANAHFNLGAASTEEVKFEADWKIEILDPRESEKYVSGFRPASDAKDNIEMSVVKVNRELRQKPSGEEATRHIEFEISDSTLTYNTADNLGIYPRNDHKTCAKLLKRLGVTPDTVFRASAANGRHTSLPAVCSAMDAMLWHLDINNPPKKSLLSVLAQFATDPDEAKDLRALASSKQKERYDKEIQKKHVSIPALLDQYRSIRLDFHTFAEICPKMQPRFYTISSSSNAQPGRITITMSIVKGGICTHYLRGLRPERAEKAPIFVRASTFRLPGELSTPIIMIGPGTGIAPFMGFLQEFEHRRKSNGGSIPEATGARVLFFGCRRRDTDFIYDEELKEAEETKTLTSLHCAFSREGEQKVYVQHMMEKVGEELVRYLQRGGYVYVCGATTMGRDVKNTFIRLVRSSMGTSEEAAAKFIDSLQSDGRYIQELWSA